MDQQVFELHHAAAFCRTAIADGQHPRQPAPAKARGRIGDDVGRAVVENQPGADDELYVGELYPVFGGIVAQLAQPGQRAHHPRDAVAVGDADAGHAEGDRFRHHLMRMRCTAQEAVVGRGDQLGEARFGAGFGRIAHAKTPWIYQRGSGFSS